MQAVTSGANPIAVKKGIDKTCDFLIGKLRENSKPVKGTGDIKVSPECLRASQQILLTFSKAACQMNAQPSKSQGSSSRYISAERGNDLCWKR